MNDPQKSPPSGRLLSFLRAMVLLLLIHYLMFLLLFMGGGGFFIDHCFVIH